MMLTGKDIILISNQMLDDRYWTSKQYITQELIKSNRVLYVEANYSFGKLFLGLMGKKWPIAPFGKLRKEKENLFVLTPFPRLPFRNHYRWVGWMNQKLLLIKIKQAITKLDINKSILWTFLHQTADLIAKLKDTISIYHCVDDWPKLLPMAGMGKPSVIQSDEQQLLSQVDVIFRVSKNLLLDANLTHTIVHDIPNGVDTDLFDPNNPKNCIMPDDMKDLPQPIIGFSGSIGKWIDIDLIIKTAKHFKNGSIVIIGLNEKNPKINKLSSINNIHFLGMKERKKVPKYINTFDVCIMPFARNKIGEGLVPLKMFEYLAMGKPIVSTESKVLRPFNEVISLSKEDDFVESIEIVLAEKTKESAKSAREMAMEYSWENRINEYSTAVKKINNNDRKSS